jgi:predicted RNA-binding Zn-ribbon protein involved in translation (DUF1610 family)
MGMYDSIYFNCPNCNHEIEEQSKSGDCTLHAYNLYDVPSDISKDLIGRESETCPECGSKYKFITVTNPSIAVVKDRSTNEET